MTYATLPQLLGYLDQTQKHDGLVATVPLTVGQELTLVATLERATSMIDAVLGFRFAGYTSAAQRVLAYGGAYLALPPHQPGSVSSVAWGSATVDTGFYAATPAGQLLALSGAWGVGAYTVTAAWGYGDPPPVITQICLELAVNLWRAKDTGSFQEVIGASDGAALRFVGGFTRQQQSLLAAVAQQYREVSV